MLKNAPGPAETRLFPVPLRNATVGWNLERWKIYYGFLKEAQSKSGGASYQGFLKNIEKDAFANANDIDRLAIEARGLRPAYKPPVLPKPVGPGKEYTTRRSGGPWKRKLQERTELQEWRESLCRGAMRDLSPLRWRRRCNWA